MNPNDQTLFTFSIFVIIALGLAIVIPYVRRQCDLVSARNGFLLGCVIFIGLSGVYCSSGDSHYADYTKDDYFAYYVSNTLFFATLLLVYHFFKLPRWVGARMLRRWPNPSYPLTIYAIVVAFGVFIVGRMVPIPVVGQICRQASLPAFGFAAGVAFTDWLRERMNPVRLLTLLGVLGCGLIVAVLLGGGRKPLLSVLMTMPVLLYWLHFRYRKATYNLGLALAATAAIFVLIVSYGLTRHTFFRGSGGKSVSSSADQLAKTVTTNIWQVDYYKEFIALGQNATDVALYLIHVSDEQETVPFQAVQFYLSNPVPRRFWPDKPVGLGYTAAQMRFPGIRVNWGPSVVGHAYHEGGRSFGWLFAMFYAVLFACVLRAVDQALVCQPNNGFLVSLFASSLAWFIAWPRGDIATIAINLTGVLILGYMVQLSSLLFFGGGAKRPIVPITLRTALPSRRHA